MTLIKKNNKGLTLIEALIWFALFAAVIYSAFVMYNHYKNEQDIYNVGQELENIFKHSEIFLSQNSQQSIVKQGLNDSDLIVAGVYPKLKGQTDAKVGTSVYGNVAISYLGNNQGMRVYYYVPRGEICNRVIMSQKLVGWEKINNLNFNQALTPTQVTNFCKGTNLIELIFVVNSYHPLTDAELINNK